VLLLCAQSRLAITPRQVRGGFRLWLLADEPDAGFGCLALDERGRVMAMLLFHGIDDPLLVADPLVRSRAISRAFAGVVAALGRFRRARCSTRGLPAPAAAAAVTCGAVTTSGRCHHAA
jgi:hypothetical protein